MIKKNTVINIFIAGLVLWIFNSCSTETQEPNYLTHRYVIDQLDTQYLVEVYSHKRNSLIEFSNLQGHRLFMYKAEGFENGIGGEPFAVHEGKFIFLADDLVLNSISLESGRCIWKYKVGEGSNYLLPNNFFCFDNRLVFISAIDYQYRFTILDIEKGDLLFEKLIDDIDCSITLYPIKVGNMLLYGNASFYSLDIRSSQSKILSCYLANTLSSSGKIIRILDKEFITFNEKKGELVKYWLTESGDFKKVVSKNMPDELLDGVTSVESVGNDCIFWRKGKLWCYNLLNDQMFDVKIDSNYTKAWEYDGGIFNKDESLNVNDIAFFAKNDSNDFKLYHLSLDNKEVREIRLPLTIRKSNISTISSFYKDDNYYFDLTTTENNKFGQHDFLLTYDISKDKLTNLVEFYNKSGKRHGSWHVGSDVVYGLYRCNDSTYYYDFNVTNSIILNTNMAEDDYNISKL